MKEIKYQILCVVIFLVAIGISIIARNAPQPLPVDFLHSEASGFQVLMGGTFSLCIQSIFIIAYIRITILNRS